MRMFSDSFVQIRKITLSLHNELFLSEIGGDKKRDGMIFIPFHGTRREKF